MQTTMPIKDFSGSEISVLIRIAIPLILTGIIEASVGFFSTLFLAHIGTKELAAGAIVQWIFFTLMVVLWGTLCAVSVLIAQKHGEKNDKAISQILRDGLFLSLLLVVPTFILLRNVANILEYLGQDPVTVELAREYMVGLSWGLVPDFLVLVLMQCMIGLGHVKANMIFTLVWVPLSLVCCYALIFGVWGLPAWGMAGLGWGTTLAYWILLFCLLAFMVPHPYYRRFFKGMFDNFHTKYIGELCQIGIPMGSMYCVEIGYFLTLTLFMSHVNNDALAANQIVMQYLGEVSVVTFAIAQAITVVMGHSLGGGEIDPARRAAYIGTGIAIVFMVAIAVIYCFLPHALISIDINVHDEANASVVAYAISFFLIAAVFQLFEAARITLFGALRGLKDTRFTLITSIISFWCISLPAGYALAFYAHLGGQGFWYGAVVGAIVGVSMLAARFKHKMQHAAKTHELKLRSQN